jgi:hypothetical protein
MPMKENVPSKQPKILFVMADHLQHQRDQLGLRGQQEVQRDRQRQDPLSHRHVRDDMVDQVRRDLRHSPRTA